MNIIIFEDLMKKYISKDDNMNEFELQRVYINPINPRTPKIHSDRRFVKTVIGSIGGTHWTCLVVKDNKSSYFDSFGGQSAKFELNQLPKTLVYPNYIIQDINSRFCGSY